MLLTSELSSFSLFSGGKNPLVFDPPFISSATREESTDDSICAEDVEAVSLAAIAATAAFLLSSSDVVFCEAKDIMGGVLRFGSANLDKSETVEAVWRTGAEDDGVAILLRRRLVFSMHLRATCMSVIEVLL